MLLACSLNFGKDIRLERILRCVEIHVAILDFLRRGPYGLIHRLKITWRCTLQLSQVRLWWWNRWRYKWRCLILLEVNVHVAHPYLLRWLVQLQHWPASTRHHLWLLLETEGLLGCLLLGHFGYEILLLRYWWLDVELLIYHIFDGALILIEPVFEKRCVGPVGHGRQKNCDTLSATLSYLSPINLIDQNQLIFMI